MHLLFYLPLDLLGFNYLALLQAAVKGRQNWSSPPARHASLSY